MQQPRVQTLAGTTNTALFFMRCDQDCPEACAVLALVQMTVLQRRRQHKQSYMTQDWIQNMTDNNRTAPVYYLFYLPLVLLYATAAADSPAAAAAATE